MICNISSLSLSKKLFQCLSILGAYWKKRIDCSEYWWEFVYNLIACIELTESVFQDYIERDKKMHPAESEWATGLPYPSSLINVLFKGLNMC